jgi:hypothetical protein
MAERLRCDQCVGETAKKCDQILDDAADMNILYETAVDHFGTEKAFGAISELRTEETAHVRGQLADLGCSLTETNVSMAIYQTAEHHKTEYPELVEAIKNNYPYDNLDFTALINIIEELE